MEQSWLMGGAGMVQSRQSLPSLSAELAPHTMSLPPSLPRSSLSLASRPPCWATASRTCTCKWRHAWTRGTTGSSTQRQVEQWAETALTHRQLRSRGIPIPIHAHTHAHACAHPCTYARTRMRPSLCAGPGRRRPQPRCQDGRAPTQGRQLLLKCIQEIRCHEHALVALMQRTASPTSRGSASTLYVLCNGESLRISCASRLSASATTSVIAAGTPTQHATGTPASLARRLPTAPEAWSPWGSRSSLATPNWPGPCDGQRIPAIMHGHAGAVASNARPHHRSQPCPSFCAPATPGGTPPPTNPTSHR